MLKAAIVGSFVDNSLSPKLHNLVYRKLGIRAALYKQFNVPAGQLDCFIKNNNVNLNALSITMPHKKDAFLLANYHSIDAKEIGIANTLLIEDDAKKIIAHNTDIFGIIKSLKQNIEDFNNKSFCIIGSGATALSAFYAFYKLGINKITIYARNINKAKYILNLSTKYAIMCDIKILGKSPIDQNIIFSTLPRKTIDSYISTFYFSKKNRFIFDVNYCPYSNTLAKYASLYNYVFIPGFEMLIYQALYQIKLFTGINLNYDELFNELIKDICENNKYA